MQKITTIDFWNGNRSAIRQLYEREILEAVLKATEENWGVYKIKESLADYPGNEESLAFTEKKHDVLVTIAGNQKFKQGDEIVIPQQLMKNLLGYQIAIIRKEDERLFSKIDRMEDLQKLNHGIPETWSDATIFRHNHYNVAEEGSFDDVFERLKNKNFDYSAFGANEVLEIFENRAKKVEGLLLEKNILFFYPFPLVFYVNPNATKIAERIEQGLQSIIISGELDRIYNTHFGDIKEQLKLNKRKVFTLDNPSLPEAFRDLKPNLDLL